MFEESPCRWNALEIFQVARSETELGAIRERQGETLRQWNEDRIHVRLRDGTLCPIEEAQLNRLKDQLDKPLLRLKAEQLVHEFHSFAHDTELLEALAALTPETQAESMPVIAGPALAGILGQLLPAVAVEPLADDLPWPVAPAAVALDTESFDDAIVRDI